MSKRDWIGNVTFALIAAATLLAASAVVFGIVIDQKSQLQKIYAKYQENAANDRRQAGKEIYEACNRITPEAARSDCIVHELETAAAKYTADKDLQAQQDMGLWAQAMFWASVAQIFLAGAGIYWIIQTFDQTQEALRLGGVTARAAEDSVDVTLDIGVAQTRAYVVPETCKIGVRHDRPFATIRLKNCGQTPADNVVVSAAQWFMKGSVAKVGYSDDAVRLPKETLGAGGTTSFETTPEIDENIEGDGGVSVTVEAMLHTGKHFYIIFGFVEYDDIFENRWQRDIRYRSVDPIRRPIDATKMQPDIFVSRERLIRDGKKKHR
jgi:hypothetical protein